MDQNYSLFSSFKIVWFFFKPYKLQLFVLFIFTTLAGVLEALNLAALYPVINYGLDLSADSGVLMRIFSGMLNQITLENRLLASCVLLLVISVAALIVKMVYNYVSFRVMTRIIGDTQKKVFEQFARADYGFYVKNQQGKLIHTGTIAPESVAGIVIYGVKLGYDLISTIMMLGLLLMLSVKATAALVVFGVIYVVFIKKVMAGFIYKSATIMSQEERNKNVVLNEVITGYKDIKIFLRFEEWRRKFYQTVNHGMKHKKKMLFNKSIPESAMKFIFFAVLAGVGVFISQYPHKEIMLLMPVFGTFVIVASRLFPAIQLVGNAFMILSDCLPNTKIVYDLCSMNTATLPSGNQVVENFDDQITFENVHFKYDGMKEDLLKGISFSVKKKEMTALVGASGSGKTTIISLLLRLYAPGSGSINIDGANIFDFTENSYLAKIGFVGQDTFIFNGSIKENIRFGLEDCTDDMIREAAKLANADEFIEQTPNKYDTIVGDSGVKLSGGQKQRIAIARAMLKKPEIIVMDEATSSLDNISEKKIQEAINRISKYTTILVIAHRLTTVRNANKIIVLDNGDVAEQGTHEELLDNRKVYYQLNMAHDLIEQEVAN